MKTTDQLIAEIERQREKIDKIAFGSVVMAIRFNRHDLTTISEDIKPQKENEKALTEMLKGNII